MILHDTTIPASRKVPGTQSSRYDIDIREFVSIGGNSVIRKALHEITDKWTGHDNRGRTASYPTAPSVE